MGTFGLALVVVLLAAAVVAVSVCRRLGLPPILGYLVVGLALGPHVLRVIPDTEAARQLAEYGVVFLMFSIGLEFSLPQLKALRRDAWTLALPQVVLTVIGAGALAIAAGVSPVGAFAVGAAVAMSSTAIVSRTLTERNELNSDHGRVVLAILLAQDVAVVPLLIAITALASQQELLPALGWATLKIALTLALILSLGRPLMMQWMTLVAARKSPELFMLNILFVTLGLAWLTEVAGLSLALGAFLAGLLIAETPYRYQVEEDVKPFRDVLLGLFFVTLGMQLDLTRVAREAPWVVLILVGLVTFKALVVWGVMALRKMPRPLSWRVAVLLAQGGEFSFVLLTLATDRRLVDERVGQIVLAALLLSMLVSPLLIQLAQSWITKWTSNDWLAKAVNLTALAAQNLARKDHVIVCGYGRSGQFLTRLFDEEGLRWLALDNDPPRLREAADPQRVLFGDCTRRETLAQAGLNKARAVVISFSNLESALRIVESVRQARNDIPIIVRTFDERGVESLLAAGATEVVPEVVEGALMLASHSMLVLGRPLAAVLKRIRSVRDERYSLFQGYFHGSTDEDDAAATHLHTIAITGGSRALGRGVEALRLPKALRITSVRRAGARITLQSEGFEFAEGDQVVVLGTPEVIAQAETALLG